MMSCCSKKIFANFTELTTTTPLLVRKNGRIKTADYWKFALYKSSNSANFQYYDQMHTMGGRTIRGVGVLCSPDDNISCHIETLDIIFRQITIIIKVCVAFVFGHQILELRDFSKMF